MSAQKNAIIACSYCKAKVQARILADQDYPPGDSWEPHRYVFLKCLGCGQVLVGYSEWGMASPEEEGWTPLVRQWPEPDQYFHASIPKIVRRSLEEAKKCFEATAYMACAVMCGRAIEGISKDKVNAKTLADGLKQLKNAKVIDEKLFEWGEALRAERNIGAHAGEEMISSQDASDVLEFAIAISEYVYILDEKYKAYQKRKSHRQRRKPK